VSCPFYNHLLAKWNEFVLDFMTKEARGEIKDGNEDPLMDLVYKVGNVKLVKPSPKLPKSSFWPNGEKPRFNKIKPPKIDPVATIYPLMDEELHRYFSGIDPGLIHDKKEYSAYKNEVRAMTCLEKGESQPIAIPVSAKDLSGRVSYEDVRHFCTITANQILAGLAESAKEGLPAIDGISFILMEYFEIGHSMENDVAVIFAIRSYRLASEKTERICKPINCHFRQGIVYSASKAYCLGINFLYYVKKKLI
jgi:hypothetical protein